MRPSFKLQIKDQSTITLERLSIHGLRSTGITPQPGSSSLKSPTKKLNNRSHRIPGPYDSNLRLSLSPRLKMSPLKTPSINLEQEYSATEFKPKSSKHFFFSSPEIKQFNPKQGKVFSSPTLVKTASSLEKIEEKRINTGNKYVLPDKFLRIEPERDDPTSSTPLRISPYYSYRQVATSHSALRGSEDKELFLQNKKKYSIKAPENWFRKTNGFRAKDDINFIKHQAKLQVFRREKLSMKVLPVQKLNLIGDTNLLSKNKSNWTKEEEFKVALLKKKMEIYGKFRPILDIEEKKNLFKQLVLEYHPDKTKHQKNISEEIFAYLQSNKINFLL